MYCYWSRFDDEKLLFQQNIFMMDYNSNIIEYIPYSLLELNDFAQTNSKSIQKIFYAHIATLLTSVLQPLYVECEYFAERVTS